MRETYLNSIKVIYIDPPYNTGKDFIYADDLTYSPDEWFQLSGDFNKIGQQLVMNPSNDGRFHTKWLNMIYPRLKIARDLLSDDGVIFISIDDNEVANLIKVCAEIFGEENFICTLPRVTKKGGKSSSDIAKNHDYILVFTKNKTHSPLQGLDHTDPDFNNSDEFFDLRGPFKVNQTLDYDSLAYSSNLDYKIELDGETLVPGGDLNSYHKRKQGNHARADWAWRWKPELFEFGLKNGFILKKKGRDRTRLYTKTYLNAKIEKTNNGYTISYNKRKKPISTLEFTDNKYSNDNSKKSLEQIMGESVFDYPKSPEIIETLMQLVEGNDYIVMDFFSGSGSTAQAVLSLNKKDGGNRKFILIQLPEIIRENNEAIKHGFTNICEIGQERIRKFLNEPTEPNPSIVEQKQNGFRVFWCDSSNMKESYYSPSAINQSDLFSHISNIKDDRRAEDLLFQVILSLGVTLDAKITNKTVNDHIIFDIADGYISACFDDKITDAVITYMAKQQPKFAILQNASLSSDSIADNFIQIFKTYSPDTICKVI